MKIDNIEEISREELNALPFSTKEIIGEEYDNIVIIPTGEMHDSGFGCMKYVLLKADKGLDVVGVVGGYSDVIHVRDEANIDCLPCGYLRIMLYQPAIVPCFIASDFFIEKAQRRNEYER